MKLEIISDNTMLLNKLYLTPLIICIFVVNVFAMEIKSDAFKEGEYISAKYTCDSINISPSLSWDKVPQGTKSFVIICDDPDAPVGTWVHWVIFNIPQNKRELKEGIPLKGVFSDGITQGVNDFGKLGYGGPCPPKGSPHRYFFKLYALDTILDLKEGAAKKEVEKAMKGHIIAETKIVGLYRR